MFAFTWVFTHVCDPLSLPLWPDHHTGWCNGEYQTVNHHYITLNKLRGWCRICSCPTPAHIMLGRASLHQSRIESCARLQASTPFTPSMCHAQCFYTIIFHLCAVYFALSCWGFLCPFLCDGVRTWMEKEVFVRYSSLTHALQVHTHTNPCAVTCKQTDTYMHTHVLLLYKNTCTSHTHLAPLTFRTLTTCNLL